MAIFHGKTPEQRGAKPFSQLEQEKSLTPRQARIIKETGIDPNLEPEQRTTAQGGLIKVPTGQEEGQYRKEIVLDPIKVADTRNALREAKKKGAGFWNTLWNSLSLAMKRTISKIESAATTLWEAQPYKQAEAAGEELKMGYPPGITPAKDPVKVAQAVAPVLKKVTNVVKNGQVGKIPIPSTLEKILNPKVRTVAARFPANEKAKASTAAILVNRGLKAGAIAFVAGYFGTYPFAAWANQEVLSGLKILSRDLREAGLWKDAEELLAIREEVHKIDWQDFVGYVNIIHKFKEFTKADILAVQKERKLIEQDKRIATGQEESDFARERRMSDEAARERELEERKQDEAYFAKQRVESERREKEQREEEEEYYKDIEEKKATQKETAREEETKYYGDIQRFNRLWELRNRVKDSRYYAALRAGDYDLAEQILQEELGLYI